MINRGQTLDDAVTLLCRATGRVTPMVIKRRISRAGVHEALVLAERACNAMRLVLDSKENES